jgi:hypothetical protein
MKKIFALFLLASLSVNVFAASGKYSFNRVSLLGSDEKEKTPETTSLNVWGELGYTGGDVTYQVGGHSIDQFGSYEYMFPISELRWPVQVPVVIAGADLTFNKNWTAHASFLSNLQQLSGKMKDIDYLYYSASPQIYSESDANLKQSNTEIGLRYWFNDKKNPNEDLEVLDFLHPSYGVGAGLLYQDNKWEASNLDQWYPGSGPWHDIVPGLVGTYAATLQFYYAELVARVKNYNSVFEFGFGYSPLTIADDEDYHLLRGIHSTSHTSGYGFRVSLDGRYKINKTFFLTAIGEYLYIQTAGTSYNLVYNNLDPYFFPGYWWIIDHKVVSGQWKLGLGGGVMF